MWKPKLALRPNCLLTRRPIVFISPTLGPFFYKKPWSEALHFLYEHGYKVSLCRLPFNDSEKRTQTFVSKNIESSHLIMDKNTFYEVRGYLAQLKNCTVTVISDSVIDNPYYTLITNYPVKGFLFSLHQKWLSSHQLPTYSGSEIFHKSTIKDLDRLLDHCIFLAELDFNLSL